MIKNTFKIFISMIVILGCAIGFFLMYAGFVYLFLGGKIPYLTQLYGYAMILIGGYVGICATDNIFKK